MECFVSVQLQYQDSGMEAQELAGEHVQVATKPFSRRQSHVEQNEILYRVPSSTAQ